MRNIKTSLGSTVNSPQGPITVALHFGGDPTLLAEDKIAQCGDKAAHLHAALLCAMLTFP